MGYAPSLPPTSDDQVLKRGPDTGEVPLLACVPGRGLDPVLLPPGGCIGAQDKTRLEAGVRGCHLPEVTAELERTGGPVPGVPAHRLPPSPPGIPTG